jgi:signal transduction histidine kinase
VSDELQELRARYERLKALHEVSNVIHSTLEPEKALDLIIGEAVRLMRASSGSAVLINPNTGFLEILASEGLPEPATQLRLKVGEGITGWVARTGKTARVGDVTKDPRYVSLRTEVRSELAIPLEVNGELRGVLNVDSEHLNAFSAEDEALLQSLAAQAAGVIQNTWLYEQLRLKAALFESLASVSQAINSALNLDDALNVITREACALMRGKVASLLLLDRSGQWLDLRASFGAGTAYTGKPRLGLEDSLVGIVVRRKRALQVANVQVSTLYQNVEVAREEGLFGLVSVPLLFAGQSTGALSVYMDRPYSFSNEEMQILSALAELSGVAIEKARLYERVVDVEEQLRQNEKLSALGLLAAEVAHEIRNPLTVLKMLYHSLDLKFPGDDPRAKDSKIIGEKIELMNKIVERILDFARSTEPEFAPVDLNELIDELGLLVRHKLKQQNVRLVQELAPDLPMVSGEPTQLEQAFLNLTLNAAEAMPRGGQLTVVSRLLPGSSEHPVARVLVEFQDTGEGMSEEQRKKAFTSLLTTTKKKGTGLGLAIVGRVVETHGGQIDIESEQGKGTIVRVMLPLPQ